MPPLIYGVLRGDLGSAKSTVASPSFLAPIGQMGWRVMDVYARGRGY